MFNQACAKVNNNTLSINAASGAMLKNYKDSFFVRCHLKSELAETLLSYRCNMRMDGRFVNVVVIQIMTYGDMEMIAEVITKENFDKLWSEGENK